MKVKTTTSLDEYGDDRWLKIEVNGKRMFSMGNGEPEDMTLGRNLNDAYEVVRMMEQAYEAGKAGETFETEEEQEKYE